MWIVAGLLLGLVVLGSVAGFHAGPHLHVAAGIVGVLAAAWLVAMAVSGRSGPVLWVLFGADLAISAGMAVMGGVGLAHRAAAPHPRLGHLEGAEGVALTDLGPDGIVRVRGEEWSAVSANGKVRAGTKVQVIRSGGLRLEVWGEEAEVGGSSGPSGPSRRSKELGT